MDNKTASSTPETSIPSAYEPRKVEAKIYDEWMESGYFTPENLPGKREKTYTIMIAPPNITGNLHMGHALENTGSDILIRFHRMRGYRTLWLPGTDHAGIATNTIVEKELRKQGLSRHDLGREKFLEKVWEWKEKYGGIILDQIKKLGCSVDWTRNRFTMDEKYQHAVRQAFEHYKEKGLIYQGERVINWCIKDQTALADLELEYVEEKSKLWFLKYPLKNEVNAFITVATTRPETMLGDTAVAVNPKDARYSKMVGKTILHPLTQREIPIIADSYVDMEFGTGAVKITPAHDFADNDMAMRNNLPYLKVINEVGKIINVGAEYDGLKLLEARDKVLQQLTALGLVEKEEDLQHNVAKCYRCGSTVEPILSRQWFLKVRPLAEKAIRAIEEGAVSYSPERWKKIVLERLANERDWCISRQIWWGHRIPIEGSEDTFDTWFSSALWPFATLGWPEQTDDLKNYYPTSLVTSARDIIHIWISKMIFSGLEFTGQVPFNTVLVHATILTKEGKRMSKSLGTGIDPLLLIEKYGADATRFGLIYQDMGGQDIHFNEDVLMMGKKFCNKLWNISRFVLLKTGGFKQGQKHRPQAKDPINIDILRKLEALVSQTTAHIEKYEFGHAAHELYDFVWHDFADLYIEQSKNSESEETKDTLQFALTVIIKLLHPFMPFITEELWKNFNKENKLIVSEWPE